MALADVLSLVRSLDIDEQRKLALELSPLLPDSRVGLDEAQMGVKDGSLMGMAGMFTANRHLSVEDMNAAIAQGARESAGL
jgi:hypothetical protein